MVAFCVRAVQIERQQEIISGERKEETEIKEDIM